MTDAQRTRYEKLRRKLVETVQEVEEQADGFTLHYTYDPALLSDLAEFVTLERLCCPFLSFGLILGAKGVVTLKLCGPTGVKAFLREEFGFAGQKRLGLFLELTVL